MLAYTGPMKIFSGTANRKFAEDICKCLDMPLGEITIGKFSDGEINLSVEETVRVMMFTLFNQLAIQQMIILWKY